MRSEGHGTGGESGGGHRVLQVIQTAGLGGSEHVFSLLARRFHAEGWPIVCAVGENGWLVDSVREAGVPVEIVPGLGNGNGLEMRSVLALRRVILSWDVELVHAMSFPAHLYASAAARLTGRPCIVNVRNSHYDIAGARRRFVWRRLIAPLATAIVAVSENAAGELRVIVGPKKIVCIPNGIDTSDLCTRDSRRATKSKLGIPPQALVMGTVGNMRPVKGHVYFLRAAAMVARELPSVRFLLIGSEQEPVLSHLREICCREGISDQVMFLGERSDTADLLAAMDIFCLPSLSEGISNSLLQAMASGLPVVATAAGGNPEVVVDGETGCTVRPGEASQLARALLRLAQDPDLCRRMGEAARLRARTHFDLDEMLRRYGRLYRRILAGTPARGQAQNAIN